ncbi:MAG TPA: hypothetical protein VHF01_01475 [Candidatus Acidoferrum sp.]|nr:hypothetical protein [Candidatus Acidoferrum sp.]
MAHKSCRRLLSPTLVMAMTFCAQAASAQVSPAEILNPDLKALEESYFPQLKALNHSIAKTKFPFPFYLSRFVGLDPTQQTEADSRGLEFVRFQDRVILKITGNYNAAYGAKRLTQNERASWTFHDVIVPIISLVAAVVPPDVNCDGIGFEISYHTRTGERNYDYEGKEILVVVLDRTDAFVLAQAAGDSAKQNVLNRSKVYLNGGEFGLSLTERDPLNVQALPRSVPQKIDATSTAGASTAMSRLSRVNPKLLPMPSQRESLAPTAPGSTAADPTPASNGPRPGEAQAPAPAPTQADAENLQAKHQAHLDTLAKEGATKFHFVDYAPHTFIVFRNQIVLQMTLRNSLHFEPDKGSIYKRAAQSFDLFLAPLLKDLLDKAPVDADLQAFDFTVLNQISPGAKGSSEAVEFICPSPALHQFANAEITNQQLIDQSVVLVNGVRIALNLQLVE